MDDERTPVFYFAFGSNMLSTRLKRRCPGAGFEAVATAPGREVRFDKRSEDTSGKANLVAGDGPAAVGVVYRVPAAELRLLDAVEGPGYRREDGLPVTCLRTGRSFEAVTYRAREPVPGLQPYDWYLALVLAGLAEHAIDAACVGRLRATPFVIDPQRNRTTRRSALRDLRGAGYPDYRSLLGQ